MDRQPSSQTASPPRVRAPPSGNNVLNVKRRKRKHQNWLLFAVLRAFGIFGPLAFCGNIIYFQFYVHTSDEHATTNGSHPFYSIASPNFKDRATEHRKSSTGQDDHDGRKENPRLLEGKGNSDEDTSNYSPSILPGMTVLERLQKRALSSFQECGGSPKSALALAQQLQGGPPQQTNLRANKKKNSLLQPFGLRLAIAEHLREMEHVVDEESTGSVDECKIPQRGATFCDANSYSIIVTFQGQKKFRQLFMNLLAWLTYPYISDILVVMPHGDWSTETHTVMDVKYKERIKAWHASKDHKVSMIGLPKQLEKDPSSKYSFENLLQRIMAKVQSDTVLFMDGSIIWDGNNRGLTAGFELWKQNPHAIVATHKLHTGAPESMCQKTPIQQQNDGVWTSFCQSNQDRLHSDIDRLHQQYQNVLDLNGVFVHRGMLCFLRHDPLASILRNNVWKSLDDAQDPQVTFANSRAILAIALLQVAGSPPLLFPPTIARPQNETKDYNNNWHYLPHIREVERVESMMANDTRVQKQVLVPLLGYFGTGLVANANEGGMIPYWCTAQKQVEGVFFITDIPWMEKSGSKCQQVAANADVLKPVM